MIPSRLWVINVRPFSPALAGLSFLAHTPKLVPILLDQWAYTQPIPSLLFNLYYYSTLPSFSYNEKRPDVLNDPLRT